ncbi:MAG: hypothetical protein WCP93_01655 [Candidatus Berkelbacteria bacterium]
MLKLPFWKQLWLWMLTPVIPTILLVYLRPLPIEKCLFIGLLFFIGVLYIWFNVTCVDRYNIEIAKNRKKELEENLEVFESLTGQKINIPVLKINYIELYNWKQSYHEFLENIASHTTGLFSLIKHIKEHDVKNWILEIQFETNNFKDIHSDGRLTITNYYICYADGQIKNWRLENNQYLVDMDGKKILLEMNENYKLYITKILYIIRHYRSVKEVALDYASKYVVPIIEKSKHACASDDLKSARILMTDPIKIIVNTDPAYPKLFNIIKY